MANNGICKCGNYSLENGKIVSIAGIPKSKCLECKRINDLSPQDIHRYTFDNGIIEAIGGTMIIVTKDIKNQINDFILELLNDTNNLKKH